MQIYIHIDIVKYYVCMFASIASEYQSKRINIPCSFRTKRIYSSISVFKQSVLKSLLFLIFDSKIFLSGKWKVILTACKTLGLVYVETVATSLDDNNKLEF